MSALGQKRTFCIAWPMSALPLKADIAERDCHHVRFVPKKRTSPVQYSRPRARPLSVAKEPPLQRLACMQSEGPTRCNWQSACGRPCAEVSAGTGISRWTFPHSVKRPRLNFPKRKGYAAPADQVFSDWRRSSTKHLTPSKAMTRNQKSSPSAWTLDT